MCRMGQAEHQKPGHRWLRRLLTVGFIFATAMVLLELALRHLGLRDLVLYEQDPAVGYRLKPGQRVLCLGNDIRVNRWGVRDARALDAKPEGIRRVVVLGDSVTWGGIREGQEALFTSVLETNLPKTEVVNAGVNGYSVSQMLQLYRAHLAGLEPDCIVLAAIARDFERPASVTLNGSTVAFPLTRPPFALPVAWAFARAHLHHRFGWDWLGKPPTTSPDDRPPGPHNLPANVEMLAGFMRDQEGKATVRIVIIPEQGEEAAPEALAQSLDEARLPWTNLGSLLDTSEASYVDGVHLTARGHAEVGRALASLLEPWRKTPMCDVAAEEVVYAFTPPNNGAGPLWCYGCTQVVRTSEGRLFASQMETGEGVPLLCNTRWRLLERSKTGWSLLAEPPGYRQREPAPLTTVDGDIFLSVNDSTEPPGTEYGPCHPHVLRFSPDSADPRPLEPRWDRETYFTDHSYRGFAADREARRLLLFNIDAETSIQHWCLMEPEGRVLANGAVTFPIRACYPQAAVKDQEGHILAISDIVEPVEKWQAYKFEQTGRKGDYVFRILYYAWAPNLLAGVYLPPIEIANVDDTAGHIRNEDLWIAPAGEAYVLYTERETSSAMIRDRFFPGKSTGSSLKLAIVKKGAVVERRTLVEASEQTHAGGARFHELPDGRVVAVAYIAGAQPGNYLLPVYPASDAWEPVPIPLEQTFTLFCLAGPRSGSPPSNTIDLFGHTAETADSLCYAQITLR